MGTRRGAGSLVRVGVLLGMSALFWGACAGPESTASGEGGWLRGTPDEKFDVVARQLRGFDMAMIETDYRYQHLYWAGEDQNWGAATYQVTKIETTIRNALERRPKRAPTAEAFLKNDLPPIKDAITGRNQALFRQRFTALTTACNACHVAEQVPFFVVRAPTVRIAPGP